MPDDSARRRARFPRGLCQPAGCLRLGLDGLLLAAFAARFAQNAWPAQKRLSALDLGCGCGGSLLALALELPAICGLGLDCQPELVAAARQNAGNLGLADRLGFAVADLASGLPADCSGMDLALANPPYGLCGCGRPSQATLREAALRQPDATLPSFCLAAASCLRRHGHFFCIFPASGLARLVLALAQTDLGLRELLPVQARPERPAGRLLIRAQKGAAHDCRLLPPLILHQGPGWSRQALAFCPRLGNAGTSGN